MIINPYINRIVKIKGSLWCTLSGVGGFVELFSFMKLKRSKKNKSDWQAWSHRLKPRGDWKHQVRTVPTFSINPTKKCGTMSTSSLNLTTISTLVTLQRDGLYNLPFNMNTLCYVELRLTSSQGQVPTTADMKMLNRKNLEEQAIKWLVGYLWKVD